MEIKLFLTFDFPLTDVSEIRDVKYLSSSFICIKINNDVLHNIERTMEIH